MNRHLNKVGWILALLPAAMMLGCENPDVGRRGINFYMGSEQKVRSISSVAFVELADDGDVGALAANTTDELAVAMREHRLFEIKVIRSSDVRFARVPADRSETLSLEQLAQLSKDLNCDAILLGTITTYQPYPRMRMGLQLKLLDLRSGEVIWAIDQVWDTSEARMEERIKKFFQKHMRKDFEPLGWRLALSSPRAFQKFIAWETACTLPLNGIPEQEKTGIGLNLSEL